MGEAFANLMGDAMNWEGQMGLALDEPNVPNQVLWIKRAPKTS